MKNFLFILLLYLIPFAGFSQYHLELKKTNGHRTVKINVKRNVYVHLFNKKNYKGKITIINKDTLAVITGGRHNREINPVAVYDISAVEITTVKKILIVIGASVGEALVFGIVGEYLIKDNLVSTVITLAVYAAQEKFFRAKEYFDLQEKYQLVVMGQTE